jgi:hypothetical protein
MHVTNFLFGASIIVGIHAQQYAGQTIPNSLPGVNGGQLSFFNIFDANGGRTTLLNYFSTAGGKPLNQTKVKRAIITLHGLNRDGWDYFDHVRTKIPLATAKNAEITEETVAVLSPVLYVLFDLLQP